MTRKDQDVFGKILLSLETITNKINVIQKSDDILDKYVEVEDGKGSGKLIKFKDIVYNQMIYTDVQNLKKDTAAFYDDYSQEMKPLVKDIKNTLKDVNNTIAVLDKRVDTLEKNKPKSFSTWLLEKSAFANSGADILKLLVYVIIIFSILSAAMPQLLKFIKSAILNSG